MKKISENSKVIYVNDGSKDNTLPMLRELAKKDKIVRYISFSRNFGKESGMYAGLEAAKGDYVVVMDADLQHPPHRSAGENAGQSEWSCLKTDENRLPKSSPGPSPDPQYHKLRHSQRLRQHTAGLRRVAHYGG